MKKFILPSFILGLIISACNLSTDPVVAEDPTYKITIIDGIEYALLLSGNSFQTGDSLLIDYRVRNLNTTEKTFYFNNIQQFGYTISDSHGNLIKNFPETFLPATSSFTLDYSQSKSFSETLYFSKEDSSLWFEGSYSITAYLLGKYSTAVALNFDIR